MLTSYQLKLLSCIRYQNLTWYQSQRKVRCSREERCFILKGFFFYYFSFFGRSLIEEFLIYSDVDSFWNMLYLYLLRGHHLCYMGWAEPA